MVGFSFGLGVGGFLEMEEVEFVNKVGDGTLYKVVEYEEKGVSPYFVRL